MAVKKILLYSENPAALREKSAPVQKMNRVVRALVKDLKETLTAHSEGIGLAAPQINVHQRVVIVVLGIDTQVGEEKAPPVALINPVIVEAGHEAKDYDGCLSFPGLYADTVRPHYLRVTGLDEGGEPFDRVFSGFDAVVVHHEIDHLDGVLFIDHVARFEDFYQINIDEFGRQVRAPLSVKLGGSESFFTTSGEA